MTAFSDVIDACVDPGVTDRPPVPGHRYLAFAVHPHQPGPITLAIGHSEGEVRILDLIRDGLTVQQAADLMHAYGIDQVTGAANDNGVIYLLQGPLS